jgi:carbamoyltransferase
MPKRILGISAFSHDSSASLVENGVLVASVEEERFSRVKHDGRFPRSAVSWCLQRCASRIEDVDLIAFYEDPVLKADRLLRSMPFQGGDMEVVGKCVRSAAAHLYLAQDIATALSYDGPLCFVQHHLSHAASAFYPSGFAEAAFLVVDGVGEWATTSLGIADGSGIRVLEEIHYPHSLGLIYSAITSYLGFRANYDEFKVMSLASYGAPVYRDRIQTLFRLLPDGSFSSAILDFYPRGNRGLLAEEHLERLLGFPARPRH